MPDSQYVKMPEAVIEFEKQLEQQSQGDFFPTGFGCHDRALGRLRRAMFILVGARPSMGKTAFMLCLALKQLLAGIRVYFFTLEMPRADMIARLVSIRTGIPLLNLLERRIDDRQVRELSAHCRPLLNCREIGPTNATLKKWPSYSRKSNPKAEALFTSTS